MPESDAQTSTSGPSKSSRRASPLLWGLILLSILLMGGGIAWGMLSQGSSSATQSAQRDANAPAPRENGLNQSELDPLVVDGFTGHFLPDGRTTRTTPESAADQSTSATPQSDAPEALFRLGFGFAAAFAAAFALKKLLKITIFAAGLVLLLLSGLQYAELIEIHWGAMAARYDTFEDWASGQFESARAFATGAIPMTATAMAGLGAGWKAS